MGSAAGSASSIASSTSRTARAGLAAVARRFGGAGAESDSVHPGPLLGLADGVPQLEGALVLCESLGMSVDVVGGEPCLDGRREGARVVAGAVPVVREIGEQLRVGLAAHRPMRIDRACDLSVQPHPLRRQQPFVDGFPHQRVSEGIAAVRCRNEHVAGDRAPQRALEFAFRRAGDGRQRLMGE